MKKIILTVFAVIIVGAALFVGLYADRRELRFTLTFADCREYSIPLREEEYVTLPKLDITFDVKFTKRLIADAKAEGTVAFDGKTYQVIAIHPVARERWTLVLHSEGDANTDCRYLTADQDFAHFQLIYTDTLLMGPAESRSSLIETLNAYQQHLL